MGFPRFWGKVSAGEAVIGPDVGEGKREDGRRSLGERELGIQWTIAYYVLLVVGAVGWWKLLWLLTETSSALSAF
jgi:prenyl protein peptidase